MTNKVHIIYKNRGETPLEALQKLKNEHLEYKNLPMTYAGRLDPMAEGVLLILTGDECLKKDDYLALPKEYEVDVLLGFSTDTYDLLGIVNPVFFDENNKNIFFSKEEIQIALKNFTGKFRQKYPVYSSRTVLGKPLFVWAREGKLAEIEIPEHEVMVDILTIKEMKDIQARDLLDKIKDDIALVKGDFRQDEILEKWNQVLVNNEATYQVITLNVVCSSGTYVRAIANDLGGVLGIPALAMNIKRTKIGDFFINI